MLLHCTVEPTLPLQAAEVWNVAELSSGASLLLSVVLVPPEANSPLVLVPPEANTSTTESFDRALGSLVLVEDAPALLSDAQ